MAKIDAGLQSVSSARNGGGCGSFVITVGHYSGNLTQNHFADVSSLEVIILGYNHEASPCSSGDVAGLSAVHQAVKAAVVAIVSNLMSVQANLEGKPFLAGNQLYDL